jgi:hypothetical protein
LVVANSTNVEGNDPHVQLARGQASSTMSEAKDADPHRHNGTFVMIDSVAAVLGLVSAGIFLAHAIESYRAYTLLRFRP